MQGTEKQSPALPAVLHTSFSVTLPSQHSSQQRDISGTALSPTRLQRRWECQPHSGLAHGEGVSVAKTVAPSVPAAERRLQDVGLARRSSSQAGGRVELRARFALPPAPPRRQPLGPAAAGAGSWQGGPRCIQPPGQGSCSSQPSLQRFWRKACSDSGGFQVINNVAIPSQRLVNYFEA